MTAHLHDAETSPTDIYACGWRLRTGLPLPAVLPWPDAAGRPDITFVPGKVRASLPDPVVDLSILQIAVDGTALVRFEEIGRFLLRDDEAICDLAVPLDAPELTAVIFGNVLACICWRRGQLSLHGSAVAIDGRAVMLLGRAGTGKSLLAAALARRGHAALSDEVAVVAGRMCLPAGSPFSLADDALLAAGIDPEPLPQYSNFPIPKRLWTGGPAAQPKPYPVAAVICLAKAGPDGPSEPQRLTGDAAVDAIVNHVFRRDMLRVLDGGITAIREATDLSAAAPVYQFPIAHSLDRVEAVADRIEELAFR